jgi:hypothetical protein
MKLDLETVRWIEVALEHIRYGEILISVHDHAVVGVDTKKRERVEKPSCCMPDSRNSRASHRDDEGQ